MQVIECIKKGYESKGLQFRVKKNGAWNPFANLCTGKSCNKAPKKIVVPASVAFGTLNIESGFLPATGQHKKSIFKSRTSNDAENSINLLKLIELGRIVQHFPNRAISQSVSHTAKL